MLQLTKKDQPKPVWKRVATLGGKPVRANANPVVDVIADYMTNLRNESVGELVAGQIFLESVLHPDDRGIVDDWPLTYDQFTDLGAECFKIIGGTEDNDGD